MLSHASCYSWGQIVSENIGLLPSKLRKKRKGSN